jgi:hypothetical protein
MKLKELKEDLANLPDDYEVDISMHVQVRQEDIENVTEAIGDCAILISEPIVGIAISEEEKRVRFVTIKPEEIDLLQALDLKKRF